MSSRRRLLKHVLASGAALAVSGLRAQPPAAASIRKDVPYRRIATEEAFSTPEIIDRYRTLIDRNPPDEPGFVAMWGAFLNRAPDFFEQLTSLGERRLADMDRMGTDMQVLSLTAPGVQVFDADTGPAVARSTNDELAEACRAQPARFAGLTTIAPQDPRRAAAEIERGMTQLGLNGAIVSSHTKGEYLDETKYWEILEAAEAHAAPIYIHPRTPAPSMLEPWLERGLHGPQGGFQMEVYLHVLGLVTSGAFDRFPNLKIVIGHLGEGLPYFMYRLDYRTPASLDRRISDYLKDNVYVTTSGMAWTPAIEFALEVLGERHVLYAMDYPYEHDATQVVTYDELSIPPETKRMLYEDNAVRVFGLGASRQDRA